MRILEDAFRVYGSPADLDRTIVFYEEAQKVSCERRVEIRETGVVATKVCGFLILSASEDRLARVFHVRAIFYIDSLDDLCLGSRNMVRNAYMDLTPSREVVTRQFSTVTD